MVEQAGEADHDIEPPAEHHIGQHQDPEIENVAVVVKNNRHRERKAEQCEPAETVEPLAGRLDADGDVAHEVERSVAEDERAQEAASEHRRHQPRHVLETLRYHQRAGRPLIGANAHQQREQAECQQRREQRAFERGGDIDAGRILTFGLLRHARPPAV